MLLPAIRKHSRRAMGPGKEAKLCFGGHALMENRNGLCVDIRVSSVLEGETAAAAQLLKRQARKRLKPTSLGGDKGYHSKAFVEFLRRRGIRPHMAQIEGRNTPGLDAPAIRQRLQPYFSAEPVAQEHARLERLAGIAVEPESNLLAVQLGSTREDREHLGGSPRLRLVGFKFPPLVLCPVDRRLQLVGGEIRIARPYPFPHPLDARNEFLKLARHFDSSRLHGADALRVVGLHFPTPDADLPSYLASEHPPALRTRGSNPLAALILSSPDDTGLDQRIRSILERRGLQCGPCRVGSDQRELWPLQCAGDLRGWTALDGAVQLICTIALGTGQGTLSAFIPLDGAWPKGDLCSVPYAKLPALSAGDAEALGRELEALRAPEPYVLPPARHYAPTAADLDLAELRRNPEALRKRLFELTGNPAVQQALLREVFV